MPRFEQYPARDTFTGTPAPVKLESARAREFRTMLRQGAAKGPNFAGHYTVVEWGCGSPCHAYAIVDARTGRVAYMADEPAALGVGHRLDSEMLVVDPPGFWREAYGVNAPDVLTARAYYYRWDGERLVLLDSLPVGRGAGGP
ncbi:MAG TPA: hypothetical protein VFQ45_07350 [Longimicrobium sp.]|nr:hypothetical protein [Longimicrobium sp.]